MEKVSIVIPVYRESKLLSEILDRFMEDVYPNKEIISVISSPTEEALKVVRKFKGRVKFLIRKKRLGKVDAINLGIKKATGDTFFFFDSDNRIGGKQNNTISELVRQMDGVDIADFPIDSIKDSFLARMASFDFTSASFSSMMYSKMSKLKPVVSGTAFAMRRKAFFDVGGFRKSIAEDMDIGWRAFEKNKSYKQIKGICVLTETPSTIKGWLRQRKRWAVGTADWFLKRRKSIPFTLLKKAGHTTVPSIFMLFPMSVLAIISMFLSDSILENFLILSFLLLPFKFPEITSVAFLLLSSITIFKSALMYFVGFFVSSVMTYAASRFLKYEFRFGEFVIYYFLYSPIMLLMFAYGFIRVGLLKRLNLADWKI